ncbi:MAG: hypothetical protein IJD83_03690 [Clostridia bacterium]|nr:hypothetical protein [Clostridia bacterium]
MSRQTDEQLAILENALTEKKLCAVNRDMIDYLSIYGYPVALTENLVALRFVYDFATDGIKIVRAQDITEVFCGEAEVFNDKIVKAENAALDLYLPQLNLESMKTLCTDLQVSGKLAAIACEGYEESLFYVGKVVSAGDKYAEVLCFDGLGVWDKKPVRIEYKKITCISLETHYVETISKYLR